MSLTYSQLCCSLPTNVRPASSVITWSVTYRARRPFTHHGGKPIGACAVMCASATRCDMDDNSFGFRALIMPLSYQLPMMGISVVAKTKQIKRKRYDTTGRFIHSAKHHVKLSLGFEPVRHNLYTALKLVFAMRSTQALAQ